MECSRLAFIFKLYKQGSKCLLQAADTFHTFWWIVPVCLINTGFPYFNVFLLASFFLNLPWRTRQAVWDGWIVGTFFSGGLVRLEKNRCRLSSAPRILRGSAQRFMWCWEVEAATQGKHSFTQKLLMNTLKTTGSAKEHESAVVPKWNLTQPAVK